MKHKRKTKYIRCYYSSQRLSSKVQRRMAKIALRKLVEPEVEYRTGKFWTD